jgi:hypothetical protein
MNAITTEPVAQVMLKAEPVLFRLDVRRMIRERAGISREQAAQVCGADLPTFDAWENVMPFPDSDQYGRLLSALFKVLRNDAVDLVMAMEDSAIVPPKSDLEFIKRSVHILPAWDLAWLRSGDLPFYSLEERAKLWDREAVANPDSEHERRVRAIMETAATEGQIVGGPVGRRAGIREPLVVGIVDDYTGHGGGHLYRGHHRWDAARRLSIDVPYKVVNLTS